MFYLGSPVPSSKDDFKMQVGTCRDTVTDVENDKLLLSFSFEPKGLKVSRAHPPDVLKL